MTLRIEDQRAIWELYKKGLNPNQISVQTSIPRDTVRRYCKRYLKAVNEAVEKIKANPEQIEQIINDDVYRNDKGELKLMFEAFKESVMKAFKEQAATKTDIKAGVQNVQP